MEKITGETLLEFQFLSHPSLSPDGRHTAFIRQTLNVKTNGYDSALCLYCHTDGQERQLSQLGPVRSFVWTDAETLLFAGARGPGAKRNAASREDATSYYALSLQGGEAQELFTAPVKGGKAFPLGDGRYVLTAAFDNNCPDRDGLSPAEREAALKEYAERGCDVLEDMPFWLNGEGITSGRRTRLCVYDSRNGSLTYLTGPRFKVGGLTVKNGKVLYIGTQFEKVQSLKSAVYLWDAASGKTTCLLEQDQYIVKLFELWQNKAVLCLTDALRYGNGENGNFYTIDFNGGTPELLCKHDHHCVGSTVGTDCKLGLGGTSAVVGDTLYFISTVDESSLIEALDLTSGNCRYLTERGSVEFLDASEERLVYLAFRGDRMGELYTLEKGKEVRLTRANDKIYEKYAVSTPEYLEAHTSAPLPIQGWVVKPTAYQPGKKYPTLLTIHGGPRLSYGAAFTHEAQMLAAAGYFVVFCNPRGSEGRGNPFADIRKRFGTIDMEDILALLDAALAKYPDMDATRLGVGGGSYGGFMTNWLIGHSTRFRAACSQRSIADWTGFEGTADIGYYFAKGQTGATHREDHTLQWSQSPYNSAHKVTTPTLFLHGDADQRCWKQEAFQMFAALKIHGVPSRLVLFDGENHELSRSGKPKQRLQRLAEMLAWYDRYLKGQEA